VTSPNPSCRRGKKEKCPSCRRGKKEKCPFCRRGGKRNAPPVEGEEREMPLL